MIYLSRSIRAGSVPGWRASQRWMEEEEQGDEGITWTLVKQLNGPSGGYRVRVKWVKKLLRLNGETRFSRLASLIIRRIARRPSNASCLLP